MRLMNDLFVFSTFCKFETVHDRDDVNISNYFEECFDFIEKAKGKIEEAKGQGGGVLVHCFAGKSRR